MFTRHFYEAEEALLSLRWCIKRGRIKEALFWCLELLDSEMIEDLQKELYLTWLWFFGVGKLSALLSLQNLETREELLGFTFGLARLPKETRDRTVITLLILGSQDTKEPDRTSDFPCLNALFEKEKCSTLERAFLRATFQGKSRLAFDLSRPLWQENSSRVFHLLGKLQIIKHKNESLGECLTLLEMNEPVWAGRVAAVAAVALSPKQVANSLKAIETTLTSDMTQAIDEWNKTLGRRQRREFGIPIDCLYSITKRGRMSNREKNLETLYTLSWKTLDGCPFWDRVLEEEAPWLDDDRLESFYDLYFPDDIPEEWSKQDQEKSHGYGTLIYDEVPTTVKYIDRWYRDISRTTYWFEIRELKKKTPENINWDTVFEKPWIETVSTWCLTPVKKRVLVLESDAV